MTSDELDRRMGEWLKLGILFLAILGGVGWVLHSLDVCIIQWRTVGWTLAFAIPLSIITFRARRHVDCDECTHRRRLS